jgi:hypothetical protein
MVAPLLEGLPRQDEFGMVMSWKANGHECRAVRSYDCRQAIHSGGRQHDGWAGAAIKWECRL